jgi:hypothetical protein
MSDHDFWVNPNGLRRSAEGFTDKEVEIRSISARITALTDPARITDATGGDGGGREFAGVHLNMAGQLHEGVRAWSTATGATGGGLRTVARAFAAVETNATTGAKALHRTVAADQPVQPVQPATAGVPVRARTVQPRNAKA